MNDRQLKQLLDMMHASSDAVLGAHDVLHESEALPSEDCKAMALKLQEESSFRLAMVVNVFINEMIGRRHKTGNFQYPFEPFDE